MSTSAFARLRRSLRRLWRWLVSSLIALLILLAVCVGLASQFLPLLARYPDTVANWLAGQIGEPVALRAVEAQWNRAGPQFSLRGLRIGSAPQVLDIDSARLQVNIYSGLWPGMVLTELHLDAPELELHRNAEGQWRLDGFGRRPASSSSRSQFEQLRHLGAIDIHNARLRVHDALRGHRFDLQRIDARLYRSENRLHFGLLLHGEHADKHEGENAARLRLAGDVAENGQAGRVYLEGLGQDWAAWAQGWSYHGISLQQARGDVRLWLNFSEGSAELLQVHIDLEPLVLQAEMPAPEPVPDADLTADRTADSTDNATAAPLRQLHLNTWQMQARLNREGEGGWRINLPYWQVQDAAGENHHVLQQGHAIHDASGLLRAEVDSITLAPLLDLARLLPAVPEALHDWLAGAKPQGQLQQLRLLWAGADRHSLQADVSELGWQPHAGIPALRGISGSLDGDAAALRLRIASGLWDMQAPGVLRDPFAPTVSGELLWLPDTDGSGPRLDTPGLHLREDSYDILLGGGVQFPPEGGALLDLRADVAEAPIVVAKRFWPVNVMPSKAVQWLDDALRDGRVVRGAALVRGNVLDWPFRAGEGRFEALAELADARLNYHDGWPLGQRVSGTARFINTAMELDLRGEVAGASVTQARGGVPDFGDAILQLDIRANGSGNTLLGLLRQSPLRNSYGQHLQDLRLGGRGQVTLALHIPLEDHLGQPRVDGHVDVERMDMSHAEWGVQFAAASGRVRFSERGFSADELNVGLDDSLGTLSIATGDYTSAAEALVEASLRGRFAARSLTERHEYSRPFAAWLQGESDWTVQFTVPEKDGSNPHLRLRSDLVGTAIDLPAPLRKGHGERLPLDMQLSLPLDENGLSLRLGRLLHLRGGPNANGDFTGLALFGDAPADTPVPARGLHIAGQVAVLDAAAWGSVASASSDDASSDGTSGLHIASLDLHAGELNLLGRRFHETHLNLQRDNQQWLFRLQGDALDGSISIPQEGLMQKGITARFQRLHWPDTQDSPEDTETNANDVADSGISPASIPPLHLESADTRFAGAELGSVWLESWPTADGLHVERLDARSPALDIKTKGDWLRDAQGERSSFVLDYSSRDTGAMLAALGFSRLLDGGAAHGQLRLNWLGGPGAFAWAKADGRLDIHLGQGRVLEVDPGAGRLFGLLSLTEIPRRLTLDFSDFFKSGFAYNQMSGSFRIQQGNAITDDFQIDAPSAQLTLQGRTGLAARDYDQTLTVLPKAGSMLPAIGAIAAGPAGAAVGAVAQAVLRQPLKEITRITYRITGSWAEPVIEPLEKEGVPAKP